MTNPATNARLAADLAEVKAIMVTSFASIKEDMAEAKGERKAQADRMAKVERQQESAARDIAIINSRLGSIEPVTNMITGWRSRIAGMLMLLGFLGTIAAAGWTFFKEWITWLR